MLVVVGDPWLSGWLVTPTLLFPRAFVGSVSLLAFCNFATCSFSRLFSPSSSVPAIKKIEPQSNVKYNTPGSLVKRSSTFSQFPTEKSKTFDFLNEEWVLRSSDQVVCCTTFREILKKAQNVKCVEVIQIQKVENKVQFDDYILIIWLLRHCSAFWVTIPKMFLGIFSPP